MPYISCEEAQCDYPEFCMSDHWVPGLREEFLRQQAESWDSHVSGLRALFQEHMEDVKFVIENWDVLDSLANFGLVRGRVKSEVEELVTQHTYRLPTTLIEAMWWVVHFVSHEIHDDGSPAIVWVKRDVTLLPPEEPSEGTDPKVHALRLRMHAPWNWCDASEPDAQAVLVSDPGALLWPHAKFIGSTDPSSALAEAVRHTKKREGRIDKAWASLKGGAERIRHESPIQRDLKIMLNHLFKQEFMP